MIFINLKKYALMLSLIFASCAPAVVNAIELDEETMSLIVDSVSIELSTNPALKDPFDGEPVAVNFDTLEVLAMTSSVNSEDSVTIVGFQIVATAETIEGEVGSLICTAYLQEDLVKTVALRANCLLITPPINFSTDEELEEDELLIEE